MGTWGIGPFEDDTAADFALAIDECEPAEREGFLRAALVSAADAHSELGFVAGVEAVAAAALVAAQCPGGLRQGRAVVGRDPQDS